MSSRAFIHIALHFAVPALIALAAFKKQWLRAWLILCATMAVDLDHLLANPIYDPNRCSIGFHPLHTWPAICVYAVLVLPKTTRLVGAGLLIHMLLDTLDCSFMH